MLSCFIELTAKSFHNLPLSFQPQNKELTFGQSQTNPATEKYFSIKTIRNCYTGLGETYLGLQWQHAITDTTNSKTLEAPDKISVKREPGF